MAPFTYLGTQLGEERSTSQVAYRFMWTGRLEVMLTGLEGCMCGEGTPPVRGSPPRSDILEAQNGLSAQERNTPGSLAYPSVCVVLFGCLLLPLAYFFTLAAVRMRKTLPEWGRRAEPFRAIRRPTLDTLQSSGLVPEDRQ